MSHRRRNRRFEFSARLSPEERMRLLSLMRAPRWMVPRIARADSAASRAALCHPARWPGRQAPSDV